MDTTEHTDVGNAIPFTFLNNNPYLRLDEKGVLRLTLQRFSNNNIPIPMDLELSSGEIVAMAGDYFTEENWSMDLNLPQCQEYKNGIDLGLYLIKKPIEDKESKALITAYNNLAAPNVTRKEIEQIYAINDANYFPFSPTLNFYAQQLMFSLFVKDYGEMLIRNQTHFTPWSVRVYILGHQIALRHAKLSSELHKLADDHTYQSDNDDVKNLQHYYASIKKNFRRELRELAHRYHAQAYAIELFTFHYYSDHFAAGHMSMVGDLRVLLPKRFGTWGSILVNSMHDELNRIGIFSINPYDYIDKIEAPSCAQGDGDFDSQVNSFNRKECIEGMTVSIQEIDKVLQGGAINNQQQYAGIKYMRDVDLNCRQPQPLLIQVRDKVYQRSTLNQIKILSPSQYEALRQNPQLHGYHEVANSWDAFVLVAKIRLFPYFYQGELVPLSEVGLDNIKSEEKARRPDRLPIPDPAYVLEAKANIQDWRTTDNGVSALAGLNRYGLLKNNSRVSLDNEASLEADVQFNI